MTIIRPQILVSLLILGGLAFYGIHAGMNEIATGCITLMGALGMKFLEKEGGGCMVQLKLWPKDPQCSCLQCTCDKADFGEKRECDCVECECDTCEHQEEEEA